MRSILLVILLIWPHVYGSELKGLVGRWSFAYRNEGPAEVTTIGVTVFRSDGTYYSAGILSAEGLKKERSMAVASSGTWVLDGKKLSMTMMETSKPELAPAGKTFITDVEEITDTYYTFRGERGVLRKDYRINL